MTIVYRDSFRDMAAHQERMSGMLLRHSCHPGEDLTRGACVQAVDISSDGQNELVVRAEPPDLP